MCNCANQPNIVIGNDEKHPLGELVELDWLPEKWATLNQCPACQQLWHIDISKQGEIGICVKVESEAAWKALDTTEVRVRLMVQNHGGLSFDTCRWKQCTANCVKGLAFCPQHAYFEMDIKA